MILTVPTGLDKFQTKWIECKDWTWVSNNIKMTMETAYESHWGDLKHMPETMDLVGVLEKHDFGWRESDTMGDRIKPFVSI